MPFGIQGITAASEGIEVVKLPSASLQCLSAFRASLPRGSGSNQLWEAKSPMPFGIQGITAVEILILSALIGATSPMPFGIQGITAPLLAKSGGSATIQGLQCLSAFRASLPQCCSGC